MVKFGLLCLSATLIGVSSFTSPTLVKDPSTQLRSFKGNDYELLDRRSMLTKPALLGLFGLVSTELVVPSAAYAASNSQEKTDKENLVKGYKRLTYLLDNWEKETTICGRTDNPYIGCERTPEKVMEYLGYKSMNDPLFRADKTLLRLQSTVPGDLEIDYMEAMDKFVESAEAGSGTAFVSSWGEANPGGGKDRIEMFIERSKRNVISSRDSLKDIMRILNLEV